MGIQLYIHFQAVIGVEYWIHLNETNSDVHMYIEESVVCSSTCCTSG